MSKFSGFLVEFTRKCSHFLGSLVIFMDFNRTKDDE